MIVDRIRSHGGEVIRDGWRLIVRRGKLTDAAMEWVRKNRDALMREYWPEYDDWLERAAIREFDGGQERETAEAEAYREICARV